MHTPSSAEQVPGRQGTAPATWLGAVPHPDLAMIGVVLAGAFTVGAWLYFAHSEGLVDPSGRHAVGRDFINLWTAGRLVLDGRPALVFDVEGFHAVQEATLGRPFPLHLWSYPPHFLFAVAPLGLFGYLVALVIWSALTLALYAWAAGGPRPGPVLLLALAPATLVNLATGQTGALAAALLFGGLRLLPSRPVAAGFLFGLLTIKPQYGLLLPLVLLLERRWTATASAVATTAALVGLSAAVFGPQLWDAYLRQNFEVTRSFLEVGTGPLMVMAPSPFMAMRLYGAELWAAYAVQGVIAVLAAIGVFLAWRSRAAFDAKVGLTGLAALLATPYAHNYDMTLVSVAVLAGYAFCRAGGDRRGERALLALVWLLPIAIVPLHTVGLVVGPWVLLGFFGWLLVRSGSLTARTGTTV